MPTRRSRARMSLGSRSMGGSTFLELRWELQGRGYSFRTEGDSKVIVNAYRGDRRDHTPSGVLAFALWDQERLVEAHRSGRGNCGSRLWLLINFYLWHCIFL